MFEGLGHIGESSTFVIDPNHPPVQHAPRRIPVTLQKEVKEKIAEFGEERHYSKGYRPHRLDQQYGHRVQARKDKNLSRFLEI